MIIDSRKIKVYNIRAAERCRKEAGTMFCYCCLYYYITQATRTAAHTLAALAGLFVIHKLVSWALWIMSL